MNLITKRNDFAVMSLGWEKAVTVSSCVDKEFNTLENINKQQKKNSFQFFI